MAGCRLLFSGGWNWKEKLAEEQSDPRFTGLDEYMNLYSKEEFIEMDTRELLSNVRNPSEIVDITEDMEERIAESLSRYQ